MKQELIIGWYEYVDLPAWGIYGIKAKVDTGARTSALHVERIRRLKKNRVQFTVVRHRRRLDLSVSVIAPIRRIAAVRDSPRSSVKRIVVATKLKLGRITREVEVSLVDRKNMIFRMILGRTALRGLIRIDPNRSTVLGPRRTGKKKKRK